MCLLMFAYVRARVCECFSVCVCMHMTTHMNGLQSYSNNDNVTSIITSVLGILVFVFASTYTCIYCVRVHV